MKHEKTSAFNLVIVIEDQRSSTIFTGPFVPVTAALLTVSRYSVLHTFCFVLFWILGLLSTGHKRASVYKLAMQVFTSQQQIRCDLRPDAKIILSSHQ